MSYTHKPTDLPNVDPTKDRSICFNGNIIARTYQNDYGQMKGTWAWFGQWAATGVSGVDDTLEEALGAVKARYSNPND
jgi:hypothetical protein